MLKHITALFLGLWCLLAQASSLTPIEIGNTAIPIQTGPTETKQQRNKYCSKAVFTSSLCIATLVLPTLIPAIYSTTTHADPHLLIGLWVPTGIIAIASNWAGPFLGRQTTRLLTYMHATIPCCRSCIETLYRCETFTKDCCQALPRIRAKHCQGTAYGVNVCAESDARISYIPELLVKDLLDLPNQSTGAAKETV